ncbi:hypothetical protein [Pseudochryseolinea flava]|uniref:Uncharacterized protein n=1 Tax=Pseudochryseolinea flava TaxID=2059302 RepID=A0A364Y9Y0_9BACT|nr:hypothetical protein [Pseudochryseolinea flava]RAW02708.1 hypothetical protein DQQ10_00955 [Pseudochryseolinea flava]
MKYLLAALLLTNSLLQITVTISVAQKNEPLVHMGLNAPWQKGKITLLNGDILLGKIRYNDNQQIVSFRSIVDGEEIMHSFRTKDVISMVLLDSVTKENRHFLCLQFNPRDKEEFNGNFDAKVLVSFFEVHYEGKKFAVVSHINAIEAQQRYNTTSYGPGTAPTITNSYMLIEQQEYIFFVDEDGIFDRYVSIKKRSIDDRKAKTKSYAREFNILEKYLGNDWPVLKEMAKQNDQNLKTLESLKWLLAEYDKILQSR